MPNIRIVKSPSFAELRQQGGYYVDKTGFIESFLTFPGDPNPSHYCPHASATLLMRPRRFGKSLLMSMLAEFFDISKDSRELFAGLKVMNNKRLCEQWMNQYPVVLLSLQNVKGATFEEAMGLPAQGDCACLHQDRSPSGQGEAEEQVEVLGEQQEALPCF